MVAGRTAEKARAIKHATRIITEGLRGSLDEKAGGALGERLGRLYDHMTGRLLRANLRNDVADLHEVAALLTQLQGGWLAIAPGRAPAPAAARPVAVAARAANAASAFAQQLQERRLAVAG